MYSTAGQYAHSNRLGSNLFNPVHTLVDYSSLQPTNGKNWWGRKNFHKRTRNRANTGGAGPNRNAAFPGVGCGGFLLPEIPTEGSARGIEEEAAPFSAEQERRGSMDESRGNQHEEEADEETGGGS